MSTTLFIYLSINLIDLGPASLTVIRLFTHLQYFQLKNTLYSITL